MSLAKLRLLQLISANLPVGGFTYSQGLEWAVEARWVTDVKQTQLWLERQISTTLTYCDLPLLQRFYHCFQTAPIDCSAVKGWLTWLLSSRETFELRQEEQQRGQAFSRFMAGLPLTCPAELRPLLAQSQLAGLAWFAFQQQISLHDVQLGWCYNWLEGAVMAAIKLVPLGQQAGQALIFTLSEQFPACITQANHVGDSQLGGGSPLLSIASAAHETQYSRLFRS